MHAFISYSHVDEKHLERLHKHMAMLKRDGLIDAWSDHDILAGSRLGQEISNKLEESQLFIALVSPDYIDSTYCYDKEFKRAQELADAGRLRIVPVILEPCDWLSSPFSELLALPKDGMAISEWTNQNVAYLDIVNGIRRIVKSDNAAIKTKSSSLELTNGISRRVKIKQEFDAIQRSDFANEAFNVIRAYFQGSCKELNCIEDLKARYETMSDRAFTCTVVNRGIIGGREAHVTIRNDQGHRHFSRDISYVNQAHAGPGTTNGSIRVEADDYNLFLTMDTFHGGNEQKLEAQQVAEKLWLNFVQQAGIEYA